jgi:beta-glucanase (GH16 family)
MFLRIYIVCILLALTRHSARAESITPAAPIGPDYQLVWHDEFDGTNIDQTKWVIRGDGPRLQGYWMKDASSLDGNGHFVVRTFKDAQGRYTTGGIATEGKYAWLFGYFEARVKFPATQGHWPAFWLTKHPLTPTPDAGRAGTEIDIMEKPWLTDQIQQTLHWNGYGKEGQEAHHIVRPANVNDGNWHTFAVKWTPTNYVFYVDGRQTWETRDGGVSQIPEFISVNEEIGHFDSHHFKWNSGPVWGTGPIEKASLPDYYLVDYVRVFQTPEETKAGR